MDVFHSVFGHLKLPLMILQGLVSIVLIGLIASRTTKNEGLSGSIGGPSVSNFKGKPGMEEKIAMITQRVGIAWFAIGVLVGIAYAQ
jgi:protein translocase SecG subunit